MAFCTKCGSALSENASFCINCGAAVQQKQITVNPKPSCPPEYQSAQPVSQSMANGGRGKLIKHISASDNYLKHFTMLLFCSGCGILLLIFLIFAMKIIDPFIHGLNQMGIDNEKSCNLLLICIFLEFLSILTNAFFLNAAKRNELQIYENSIVGTSGSYFTIKSFEIEYKNISSALVYGTKKQPYLEIKARAASSPELYTYVCYIKNPRKTSELINSMIN